MQLEYVVCLLCEFTVEFTAHQLHAQSASLATHHRDNADVLSNDWRVKQVGLGAVVVYISHKYLRKRGGKKEIGRLKTASSILVFLELRTETNN